MVAQYYLRKNKKREKNKDIIKVGFCAEMPAVWDKVAPVFEFMLNDKRFEVKLVFAKTINTKSEEEFVNIKKFFIERYPNVEYIVNGEEICLKDYRFNYFFYQRPYNALYTNNMRVENVRKYTKICYIPYGYSGSKIFDKGNTNIDFFENVYLGFIELEEHINILKQQFKRSIEKGYQYFEKLGYPAFEKYIDFESKIFQGKVLWTPRWTIDDDLGGSHFFDYKDDFLELSNQANCIFRPHPLMFKNFVDTGLMSSEEVVNYISVLKKRNIEYSEGVPIIKDFENTDILLTDYSSIIAEFFLTGKPIIYCKAQCELNEEYSNLMQGIYIAENWEQVEYYLNNLLKGNDYLKEERIRIISEHYSNVRGAAKRIVDRIIDDYTN